MKTYIVQARFTPGGRLATLGTFNANTHTGAIIHAAKVVRSCKDDAIEFVATLKEA